MNDTTTAAEAPYTTSETEASREVTAQAAPDNPNPTTEDGEQRTDRAPADPSFKPAPAEAGGSPPSSESKPLERITASDRSRAEIAARFKEKRAAQGGQVEFHGDMRDPSQTYAGFAPQPDDGTASQAVTLPLVGRVGAEGAGVGVVTTGAMNDPPPPLTPPHKGEGNLDTAQFAPPDPPRLVKVKVHGREAWLPEGEVIAEAQKSLAAGNLLETAKEVLSGARDQMTDDGGQPTEQSTDPSSALSPPPSDPYLALAQTLQLEDAAAAGTRLKQTIASETAKARQEAAREAARQVRIENELAASQRALAAFEQAHPDLTADEFARDAVTTQVQREINADLQAALTQGILKELPRSQDERNGLHTQLRAFGAPVRAIGDIFDAAGTKYASWRGGKPAPVAQPQTTAAPPASRVELTTARQERRAHIVTQPTNGTAPPRAAPAPELTMAQRRSAAVMAMRKARGQIVA